MTDAPPPLPTAKRRSGLPAIAWVGIGVAGLLLLGVAGYAGYVGLGVARATTEFLAEFETTMEQMSAEFRRFDEHGGAQLSTVNSKTDLDERLAILEQLTGQLEIGLADAKTGKRLAAMLGEHGVPPSMIEGAVDGFTGEASMQRSREWLEAELAAARAATELLQLARRHYGAWSADANDELAFPGLVDPAVRENLEAAAAELERTAAAATAAYEGLEQPR